VIQTGFMKHGRVEVVAGLDAGDRVITRGHTGLIDGSLVSLREADGDVVAPDVASGNAEPQPAAQ
jgi:multidrug efflux pump subunit AcrA (membrane-fusion protein)